MNQDHPAISEFDRLIGALEGLPDVVKSKPSTIRAMMPLIGIARSYIVQTYRQKDRRDTVFLETIGGEGSIRLAIPPPVADAIARQREALTGENRSKAAKQTAADRKARGSARERRMTKSQLQIGFKCAACASPDPPLNERRNYARTAL
jgi:hypothetical protein